jgi:hypothetical protein
VVIILFLNVNKCLKLINNYIIWLLLIIIKIVYFRKKYWKHYGRRRETNIIYKQYIVKIHFKKLM